MTDQFEKFEALIVRRDEERDKLDDVRFKRLDETIERLTRSTEKVSAAQAEFLEYQIKSTQQVDHINRQLESHSNRLHEADKRQDQIDVELGKHQQSIGGLMKALWIILGAIITSYVGMYFIQAAQENKAATAIEKLITVLEQKDPN